MQMLGPHSGRPDGRTVQWFACIDHHAEVRSRTAFVPDVLAKGDAGLAKILGAE